MPHPGPSWKESKFLSEPEGVSSFVVILHPLHNRVLECQTRKTKHQPTHYYLWGGRGGLELKPMSGNELPTAHGPCVSQTRTRPQVAHPGLAQSLHLRHLSPFPKHTHTNTHTRTHARAHTHARRVMEDSLSLHSVQRTPPSRCGANLLKGNILKSQKSERS